MDAILENSFGHVCALRMAEASLAALADPWRKNSSRSVEVVDPDPTSVGWPIIVVE